MQKSVLNKQGQFGVKILWRYTDIAIFVLRCFILTHPVYISESVNCLRSAKKFLYIHTAELASIVTIKLVVDVEHQRGWSAIRWRTI